MEKRLWYSQFWGIKWRLPFYLVTTGSLRNWLIQMKFWDNDYRVVVAIAYEVPCVSIGYKGPTIVFSEYYTPHPRHYQIYCQMIRKQIKSNKIWPCNVSCNFFFLKSTTLLVKIYNDKSFFFLNHQDGGGLGQTPFYNINQPIKKIKKGNIN